MTKDEAKLGRPMSEKVTFRLDLQELRELEALAAVEHVTVSQYVRDMLDCSFRESARKTPLTPEELELIAAAEARDAANG